MHCYFYRCHRVSRPFRSKTVLVFLSYLHQTSRLHAPCFTLPTSSLTACCSTGIQHVSPPILLVYRKRRRQCVAKCVAVVFFHLNHSNRSFATPLILLWRQSGKKVCGTMPLIPLTVTIPISQELEVWRTRFNSVNLMNINKLMLSYDMYLYESLSHIS